MIGARFIIKETGEVILDTSLKSGSPIFKAGEKVEINHLRFVVAEIKHVLGYSGWDRTAGYSVHVFLNEVKSV